MLTRFSKFFSGNMFGGMLLIAGSCIGAGMLGLPVIMGLCGFFPSLILFFVTWIFMSFTGLLLVEVNGRFNKQVNIISMVESSLGAIVKVICWALYLFLFYALLVAYISGSGQLVSSFFPENLSQNMASIICITVFGILIFLGTRVVDISNRILMFGLIVSYIALVSLGFFKSNPALFFSVNFKYFLLPVPVLITSFGFHNMIPSLVSYMKGDLKKAKFSIIGGSLIALIIYFFWIIVVLGIVPIEGSNGLFEAYKHGSEATIPLRNILKSAMVSNFAAFFAFFAIVTSFLAQGLGLCHFIADGLKVRPNYKNNWWLTLLALLIPSFFALMYPGIFFKALGFAGAYCAIILFGIFPALMVWKGRYIKKEKSLYHVKGGKMSLILVMIFSFVVIFSQIFSYFN